MPTFDASSATPVAISAVAGTDEAVLGSVSPGWYTILVRDLLDALLRVSTANVFKTATNHPLVVKQQAGQTLNLQEWQDSSNALLASIGQAGFGDRAQLALSYGGLDNKLFTYSNGDFYLDVATNCAYNIRLGSNTVWYSNNSGTTAYAYSPNAVPLIVKGFTAQVSNLQEWQTSTSSVAMKVNASGTLSLGIPPTDTAPLNIQVDGGGNGFTIFNNSSDYTRFVSGGVLKGLLGTGTTQMVIDNGSADLQLSGGKLGFFSITPVVRQTGGAATAGVLYTSAEQTMLNAVYTALRNYGLLT